MVFLLKLLFVVKCLLIREGPMYYIIVNYGALNVVNLSKNKAY